MKIKVVCVCLLVVSNTAIDAMEEEVQLAPKINGYAFSLIAPYNKVVTKKAPPSIGVYGPEYPMITQIGRIQLAANMIANWLPPALKKELPTHVPDLIFNVQISRANAQTYNIVFHPWAREWQPQKLFDIEVPMGIFAANGVQPAAAASIAFGKLTQQNVHVHNGKVLAYSPNNAKFTVSPNRDIVTFWSLAVSANKQHAIVTFHILVTTNEAQEAIENALHSSDTLGAFLNALDIVVTTFARSVDQQALQQAVQTIDLILGKDAPPQPSLKDSLYDLAHELDALSKQLHKPLANVPFGFYTEKKEKITEKLH